MVPPTTPPSRAMSGRGGGRSGLCLEPADAATREAVGQQGYEVEDPSLGEQLLQDPVEAGGDARAGPVRELPDELLSHAVQRVVEVCVGHDLSPPRMATGRCGGPAGCHDVAGTADRTRGPARATGVV